MKLEKKSYIYIYITYIYVKYSTLCFVYCIYKFSARENKKWRQLKEMTSTNNINDNDNDYANCYLWLVVFLHLCD
jgi:hypothetical protein